VVNNYPDRPDQGPLLPDTITANRKYTIGFSHPAFDSSFFVAVQYGAEEINCIFTFGGGYDHPEKQVNDVEDLIAQRVDAIAVDPADDRALIPVMDKGVDNGIIVTAWGLSSSGKKYYGFEGVSHYEAGVTITRQLIEAMGGKGNIIVVEGPKGALWSDDKGLALDDLLSRESDIKIVARQNTDSSRAGVIRAFEDLRRANPDFQGVWVSYVDMAIGVIQVLKNNGYNPGQIQVASNGWVPEAKAAIEEGWLYGTALQQGVLTGQQGIRLLVSLLNGEKPPFHVVEPMIPVTKANLATTQLDTIEAPAGWKPTGRIVAN
jgi:ribose transport system substrate-binding protein